MELVLQSKVLSQSGILNQMSSEISLIFLFLRIVVTIFKISLHLLRIHDREETAFINKEESKMVENTDFLETIFIHLCRSRCANRWDTKFPVLFCALVRSFLSLLHRRKQELPIHCVIRKGLQRVGCCQVLTAKLMQRRLHASHIGRLAQIVAFLF